MGKIRKASAKLKIPKKLRTKILRFALYFLSAILIVFGFYNLYFTGRVLPGVYVAGVNLTGLTKEEAIQMLTQKVGVQEKILIINQNQNFEIALSSIDFSYDFDLSAAQAYNIGRSGNIVNDFRDRLLSPFKKVSFPLLYKLDKEKLSQFVSVIAGQVSVEAVYPSAKVVSGKVTIEKGSAGKDVDVETLTTQILESFDGGSNFSLNMPISHVDPSLDEAEAENFERRAGAFIGKTLKTTFEYSIFTFRGNDLLALVSPESFYEESVNREIDEIKNEIERDPQNPTFVFESGRVKEFAPAKDGVKIKQEEFRQRFLDILSALEASEEKELTFEVPVTQTPPEIQTSDVNNLGIKELIGRGSSRFRGSISSRIYNISLASSRLSGILVKPGEIFSFNNALGDVSKLTGYKEAYVIKDGKTVLGDGGGVCQVSTTLFRAVLNAGLPIVERRAHSYRVGYYEQDASPGFDATVYSPTTDLRIKNDTPAHILIQPIVDTKTSTLVFEIYGTKDGRVAKTTKPVISDIVPPPDDLYTDDPTLPSGQIKQIDYKASGAKVIFKYTVEKDGELTYQKTFVSNFRPWQAVYLRGVGPAQ